MLVLFEHLTDKLFPVTAPTLFRDPSPTGPQSGDARTAPNRVALFARIYFTILVELRLVTDRRTDTRRRRIPR